MLSNLGRSLFSQWVYSCTSPLAIASFTHVPALNKQAVFISKGHGFKRSSTQLDTISLQVPPIGESILKGTVAFVLKPGIQFGVDDLVAQVKTDKDTVDVLAHVPGAFEKVEVLRVQYQWLRTLSWGDVHVLPLNLLVVNLHFCKFGFPLL